MTIRESANGIEINEWNYLIGFNNGDETEVYAGDIEDLENIWDDLRKEFGVLADCVDYIESKEMEVKAKVCLCDGKWCNGYIKVAADNRADAIYAAMDKVGKALYLALPELDIEYEIEIVIDEEE